MNDANDLTGTWHCRYWYENTKHSGRLDTSEYDVEIDRTGDGYLFHSMEHTGDLAGSRLEGRLGVDGSIVTGVWREDTVPQGEWNGMTYEGGLQLILEPGGQSMSGKWVAATYNNANPKIATNKWEFTRLSGQ